MLIYIASTKYRAYIYTQISFQKENIYIYIYIYPELYLKIAVDCLDRKYYVA